MSLSVGWLLIREFDGGLRGRPVVDFRFSWSSFFALDLIRLRVNGMTPTLSLFELIEA